MSSATLLCFSLLALAGLACAGSLPGLMPRIHRGIAHMKIRRPVANTFNFTNCGGPNDLASFKSLTLSPDPVVMRDNVAVSFEVDIFKQLAGFQLNLNVTMEVQSQGSGWIRVPCVLDVGSCYYRDVCSYMSGIKECPDVFNKHGIPCKCPFNAGNYKLPVSSFYLDAHIPSADYRVKLELTQEESPAACAIVVFSVA